MSFIFLWFFDNYIMFKKYFDFFIKGCFVKIRYYNCFDKLVQEIN